MPIVCVEQSRTTIELHTAPYTISGYHVQVPGSTEEGMSDGALYSTGCVAVPNLGVVQTSYALAIVDQAEASAKVETIYGSGDPSDNLTFTLWGGRLFSATFWALGSPDPTVCQYQYWRVPYTPGVAGAAIPVTTKPMIDSGFTDTGSVFQWPVAVAWSGLTTPSVALANYDYSSGLLSLRVVTDSGEVSIPTFAQFPPYNTFVPPGFSIPYSTFPNMILPDAANHRNYMLTQIGMGFPGSDGSRGNRGTSYGVMYVVVADDVGTTLTSDSLTFSASDINKTLCDNMGYGNMLVTPDYFIFYMDRFQWEFQILGLSSPSNGGVVIKVAKDFSKYWVDYLTYLPGDANAQAQLDQEYNSPMIVFDAAGAIYYMDPYSSGDPTSVLIEGGAAPLKTLTDADLFFTPTGGFVDFSDPTNRRLFVASGGGAQYLGTDGERPFGSSPPVFLSAFPGDPRSFAQNRGVGGGFAVSGDLFLADSSPACTPYSVLFDVVHGADPLVRLSVSDDGGRTWSTLVKCRSLGQLGHYKQRLRWLKMGQFRQRIIKIEITDPVRRNIVGIYEDVKEGLG